MAATVIGLDIGRHTVRAVAVRHQRGRIEIVATATVSRIMSGDDADGAEAPPKPLEAALVELDNKLPLRGTIAVASSEVNCLVRYLTTAPMPPDRLNRLLRLDLQQQAEGSELAADHMSLPAADEFVHCCAIAQPAQVYSLLVDLRAAKVEPARVGFAAAEMANPVLFTEPGARPVSGDQLALVVDIGAGGTAVSLVGEDRFLACRLIPVGGETFTENVVVTSRMTRPKAEAAKLSGKTSIIRMTQPAMAEDDPFGQFLDEAVTDAVEKVGKAGKVGQVGQVRKVGEGDGAEAEQVDESDDAENFVVLLDSETKDHGEVAHAPPGVETIAVGNTTLGPELAKAAEGLYAQIASSLTWFKAQAKVKDVKLAKVLLCGGGAGLGGLDGYLARRCECPVKVWDPFAGYTFAGKASKPERPHEFAAAFGLALGGVDSQLLQPVRYDLRPDGILRKEAIRDVVVWPWLAAGLAAAACIIAGLALYERQSTYEQEKRNHQEAVKEYERNLAKLKELDKEKEALSEDLRAIASRIYAGRDFLNVVRMLKEAAEAPDSHYVWVTRVATEAVGVDGAVSAVEGSALAPAGGRPAPTTRGVANRQRWTDSAIDRGSVVVAGQVKFDVVMNRDEIEKYLTSYYDVLRKWTPIKVPKDPPNGFLRGSKIDWIRIFDEDLGRRVETTTRNPLVVPKKGYTEFRFHLFFEPTSLDQAIQAAR